MSKSWLFSGVLVAALVGSGLGIGGDGMHTMRLEELTDLQDGETRQISDGVTAQRSGDMIELTVQGEDGKEKTISIADVSAGATGSIVVDGGDGHQKVMVKRIKAGEGSEEEDVNVFVQSWTDEEGQSFVLDDGAFAFVGEGDAGKLVKMHLGHENTLRCPEGDTVMHLDEGDAGSYYCPKHNLELEKAEGSGHRMMIIEKQLETVDETE